MEIKIIIYVLICVFIVLLQKNINESFKNKNNIWMYWESKNGGTKAAYLELCYKTIVKNCQKSSNVHLLNEKTVYNYLPNLRNDLDEKCSIPQKADYIRISLLKEYGGLWLDADVIVFKPLDKLFLVLEEYDFIGFGCHFIDCNRSMYGYPKPANWVIGSKKNGKLMTNCVNEANNILDYTPNNLKRKYHSLGRELLWSQINKLLILDKEWKYYHFNSKCIERDSNGNKLVNKRFISNEEIDQRCKDKFIFMPVYNTAPGFPAWFTNMSESEIINSNTLFSKLISYALQN